MEFFYIIFCLFIAWLEWVTGWVEGGVACGETILCGEKKKQKRSIQQEPREKPIHATPSTSSPHKRQHNSISPTSPSTPTPPGKPNPNPKLTLSPPQSSILVKAWSYSSWPDYKSRLWNKPPTITKSANKPPESRTPFSSRHGSVVAPSNGSSTSRKGSNAGAGVSGLAQAQPPRERERSLPGGW